MSTLLLALLLPPAASPGGDEWKYDVIHRKAGQPLAGLILEQGSDRVKIRCITRKRGSPTVLFTEIVPRAEIRKLELLSDADRKTLQERLEGLKRERDLLAEHLRALDPRSKGKDRPEDLVDLEPAAWPPDEKVKALGYTSAHFRLVADTRPELAQLAAIHLEQVYTAYARSLPPRTKGTPTTILLTRSLAGYRALAKSRGLDIFNPAFYDPKLNQVVCGSDLERLYDELAKARQEHAKLRAAIKERRAELVKAYRVKAVKDLPREIREPLDDAEGRMAAAERRNDAVFARAQQKLFRRLYHEAFHAYLNTFVYPARDGQLPHWFNEGLAQIFETAIVEVGELRVGHADPDRLLAARAAVKKKALLPLADLLRSTGKQFLVAHSGDQQVSDRYYLASWALAFYLTFDRELLKGEKVGDYVKALKRGTDPLLAFRDLAGRPVDEVEKDFLDYLAKLKFDGTRGK